MATNGNRDVTLAVGIKTSGEDALRSLANEVQNLAKRGGDAAPAYQQLAAELNSLAQQAGQLEAFKALAADVDRLTEEQQQAAAAASTLNEKLLAQRASTQALAEAQRAAQAAVRDTRNDLNAKRDALTQLNIETDRAAKGEEKYLNDSKALKQEILSLTQALRTKRETLQDATAQADAAEKAENKLSAQYERSVKAASQIESALNAQRTAMASVGQAAEQLGADIGDVTAAERTLMETQQRLVAEVAEKRTAAIRAQAEADREAVLAARGLAEAREQGALEAQSELAAIRESEEFLRRYARAQQEAAAAAVVAAKEQEGAERALQALRLQSLNDLIRARQADAAAAAKQAEADERANQAADKAAQSLRLQALNETIRARQAAIVAANEMAKAERLAAEESERLARASTTAGERLREAFGQTGVRSLQAISDEVRRVNIAVGQLERQFQVGAISAQDLARAVSSAQVRLAQLAREAETIPALPGMFERLSSSINGAINRFGALGAAIATVGVAVKPVIDATVELERMSRVLTTVTGSSAEAARQIEFLRSVSQRAGQNFNEVGTEYAKFAAAALGAGVSLSTVQKTFETVALAAGNLGLSTDQTSRILNALGQSASKGVIQMEELRGQLGDALPGAMSLLAKGLGLTDAQLIKVVESGNLLARDALPALAQALTQLGPKNGEGVTGLIADFNRLKNVLSETATILTDGAFGKAAGLALGVLGGAVERVAFGVAYLGESFTVVGRQIGIVIAALVSRDFKNLGAALDEVTEQSTKKLAGLAERIGGTGQAATQAAGDAKTLGDAMRETTLQVGKVAEAQVVAGTATGAAAAQAQAAVGSWVQLSVKLAENVTLAEKAAVVADTVAKAKKTEAEAAAAVIAISGDEAQIRAANARAATSEAAALQEKAKADELVAQRLREGMEALEARARAEGRNDDATKKSLETLRQSLAAKEADAERSRQQADAARVHAAALEIQAAALQDNSGKVQFYRDELDKAISVLASSIELMGRDKATKDDVRLATEGVAKAEAMLRDAISDRNKQVEIGIESMKADHQIKRAGIQLQIEESKAAEVAAKSRGDEAAALRERSKQRQLEIDLQRDQIAMTLEEARARKKAAEEELRDTQNLLPEKRAELELRIKNANAKIAEAAAGEGKVKVLEAEKAALDRVTASAGTAATTMTQGMGAAKDSVDRTTASVNLLADAWGNALHSVAQTAGSFSGDIDRWNASVKAAGMTKVTNTASGQLTIPEGYYFDSVAANKDPRFQKGLIDGSEYIKPTEATNAASTAAVKAKADAARAAMAANPRNYGNAGYSVFGEAAYPSPSPAPAPAPITPPPAPTATPTPAPAPASVNNVNITIDGVTTTIGVREPNDAERLVSLLRELTFAATRANA